MLVQLSEMWNGHASMRTVCQFHNTVYQEFLHNQAIPIIDICSRDLKTDIQTKHSH